MFNFFSKKSKDTDKLFFHTDIHCHVIPGIDDGSPSVEKSVELIRRMEAIGLTRIIATPHVTDFTFENTPEIMDEATNKLIPELNAAGVNVDLSHSAEYRLDDFFKRQFKEDNLSPMPNKFLLVENSFIQEPWGLDGLLFEIKVKGYTPILAHPERYTYYAIHKERYKKLHEAGTLFQVNLLSLASHYGKDTRRVAEYLIENEMVDFIGTDIHNSAHLDQIERYLGSKDYKRDRAALDGVIRNDRAFI